MKSYSKRITVQESDLDDLNHVNNIRYIEWIQDISKEHWQATVPKPELENYIWVVRHHDITYYGAALLGQKLEIKTNIEKWHGALSQRKVTITNIKNNKVLVSAVTEWCLLNPANNRPTRVPTDIAALFID